MEERGRVMGCGGWGVADGAGLVWGGLWAGANPEGIPARATVLRNPRRPVGVVGICCECIIVRGGGMLLRRALVLWWVSVFRRADAETEERSSHKVIYFRTKPISH
jgi:hypothetical protein